MLLVATRRPHEQLAPLVVFLFLGQWDWWAFQTLAHTICKHCAPGVAILFFLIICGAAWMVFDGHIDCT